MKPRIQSEVPIIAIQVSGEKFALTKFWDSGNWDSGNWDSSISKGGNPSVQVDIQKVNIQIT